jgi:sugar lactone lactonase YvrE
MTTSAGTFTPHLVAGGLIFPEGPRWREGCLWFSDMLGKRIMTVDEWGDLAEFAVVEDRPSGLGWGVDGRLLVVSMMNRTLLQYEGTESRVFCDLSDLSKHPFNDMVIDSTGRAYIGNMGYAPFTKEVMRPSFIALVNSDGSSRIVADGLRLPNGMAITRDDATLLVAETFGQRLLAFDIYPDGTLGPQRVFADLGSYSPDGISLDPDGNVWVALPLQRSVIRVSVHGTLTHRIDFPGRTPLSCVLGGVNSSILFVCSCRAFKERGMMSAEEALYARPGCIESVHINTHALERWEVIRG